MPGIERVIVRSYCGRTYDNCEFFRLADDKTQTFPTLAAARRTHGEK
jgi:hypothetical protein